MARARTTRCPNCHAPLSVQPQTPAVRCKYCGLDLLIEHTRLPWKADLAHPLPGGRAGTPPAEGQLPPARPPSRAVLFIVLAVLGLGSLVSLLLVSVQSRRGRGPHKSATAREDLSWVPGSVQLHGEDAARGFVGLFRLRDDGVRRLYVGAYRGADLQRLWKAGPFGSSGDPDRHTRFIVAGDAVVVADSQRTIRAYHLATGAERWSLSLSDRVERICADPDGRTLFAEVVDGAHQLIDLGVGRAERAKHPEWCAVPSRRTTATRCWSSYHRSGRARAACFRATTLYQPWRGFRADHVLEEGGTRVLVGYKHPGTRTPLIARARENHTLAWTQVIPQGSLAAAKAGSPEVFDLVRGRVIILYQTRGQWRMAAFDAVSGGRQWDTPLRAASQRKMTIGSSRIYLPLAGDLDVFALDSGERIGSVRQGVAEPGRVHP